MNRIRSLILLLGRFFTHTLGVRFLFALGISVVLWVVFTAERNPEREGLFEADIPVETSRLGDGLVLSRVSPSTVRLRIAAPRDIWDSLKADDFRVVVDLYAVGVGLHELPINTERSDSRIRIIAAEPDSVTIALDQRKEKEVPVRVELVGAPPRGYGFQPAELLPDIVKVIGPASKVDLVDAAWLRIEVDNAQSAVSLTQRAIPRDAQGEDVSGVQLDPPVVQVTVPVEQIETYKDVPVRINIVGQPAPGYWVSRYLVRPAIATLFGPPQQLENLSFVSTEAISIAEATRTFTTIADLRRPPGVGISSATQVGVLVEILPIVASAETQVAVTYKNLQPGMRVQITPATVAVTLSGPAPALRTLQAGSVMVSLDLSGVGVGAYALQPSVSLPPEVEVEDIAPSELQVVVWPVPTPTPVPTATPTPTDETPTPSPTPTAETAPASPTPVP